MLKPCPINISNSLGGETINDSLDEIKDYIDHNYHRNICLNFFAERYQLTDGYLSQLFEKKFSYNIYEYVLKVRMDKARELLADQETKIVDVAKYIGFHDRNYFSRAFKIYYGISPTEYRESL